jgi:DNA-binding NarL/FixJ family response regulator
MRVGAEKRDRSDIKVLVADDQKIVREGLVILLGLLPGITVIGAATDGEDAVRQALELRPDVVLMDLNMPHCNGVEATERLRRLRPDAAVVVLTTYSDDAWVFAALQAGARGFLTKDAGTDEIQRAITDVAAGHAQLDPAVQRRLIDALHSGDRFAVGDADADTDVDADEFAGASAPPGTAAYTEPPEGLTRREAEVLTHIAAGESNGEIATALYVSEATVKTHIHHILNKTGLRDRSQLVSYAFRNGLTGRD